MFRFLGYLFTAGFVMFIAGAVALGYIIEETSKTLPDAEQLARYEPAVLTRIHAGDGSLLAEYAEKRRLFVPINTVPPIVTVAICKCRNAKSLIFPWVFQIARPIRI